MNKRFKARMSQGDAETLALQILAFLAEDRRRLERFLALTGLRAEALQTNAGETETLLAVTQHLLDDESLLLVFASQAGVAPEHIAEAHRLLGAKA